MVDPKDYGDRSPSDVDDVNPGDPSIGFSEVDYRIRRGNKRKTPVEHLRTIAPSDEVIEEPIRPRVYPAIVVGWANDETQHPRYYWCLRSDGAVGTACDLMQEGHYKDYRIGDHVSVIMGTSEQDWQICGAETQVEQPQIFSQLGSDLEVNGEAMIPFTDPNYQVPVDDLFGGFNQMELAAGGVLIHKNGSYRFILTVDIVFKDVVDDSTRPGAEMWFDKRCMPSTFSGKVIDEDAGARVGKLSFSKENDFNLVYDPETCTLHVSLEPPHTNSIMNKRDVGPAVWTQEPIIAGSLHIARNFRGWLKMGNPQSYFWMRGGGGRLKLNFPPGPGGCGFLKATGVAGECVQLGWQQPGGDGVFSALRATGNHVTIWCGGYSYNVYTLDVLEQCDYLVENGLIIADSCGQLSAPVCGIANCSDNEGETRDPCGED